MNDSLHGFWFLGTTASFGADLSLAVMLLAAVLFTIGWRLAARKNYEAHRWVQTAAVCLNTVLVLAWMIRRFLLWVLPEIPSKLGQASYAVTTVHAVVGLLGVVLGVFVVLRANELVPKRFRFANYKLFMRSSYALYMLATLLGVIVYVVVYGGSLK
jgi:uncharacterized membrane protein YozB (DUF420 family)